jgi:hypothetical protein
VTAVAGENTVNLRLTPVERPAPDAGLAASPPDAAVVDEEPQRPVPARPVIARRTIKLNVTPPTAKLSVGGRPLPRPEVDVAENTKTSVRAVATGYAEAVVPVDFDGPGTIDVVMQKLPTGQLFVRAEPPDANFLFNDQKLGNPVNGLELPVGEHVLWAIWDDGKQLQKKRVTVTIDAGKETRPKTVWFVEPPPQESP